MRLDWSVPIWQILSFVFIAFGLFLGIVRKLDRVLTIFEEFPPHRHVGDQTIFPKGMKVNGD